MFRLITYILPEWVAIVQTELLLTYMQADYAAAAQ